MMKLKERYEKAKEDFKKSKHPNWMWDDEEKIYCLQEYISSMGEFSKEDWDFIHEEHLEEEADFCLSRD